MKIVIVGATSAMAEHCARLWVLGGASELVLVARNLTRLEAMAADLRVRAPSCRVSVLLTRFDEVAAVQTLVGEACRGGVPDIVLIAHGSLPDQAACQNDLALVREALEVNALSPVLFAEGFAAELVKVGRGTLVVIGSVAGDRGRRSNYVYGAAKGLVARYVQGLQHRFAGTAVKAILVKPGPTRTPMTAHMPGAAGMADVEEVARTIVSGVARATPVIYAPAKWALIMMVIRHLPRFIFNKMEI